MVEFLAGTVSFPGFPGAQCRAMLEEGTGEAKALFAVATQGAPSRTALFGREGSGRRCQQHQAMRPTRTRIAQRHALQASLALGRLRRGVQGLQQRGGWRAGAAQQEIEARTVPRIVEELPGGRVGPRWPGERKGQREVLCEHADGEVILLAQRAVGAPDSAEMRLPELRVAAVDVGEARRGGRSRTCDRRNSQRGVGGDTRLCSRRLRAQRAGKRKEGPPGQKVRATRE